MIFVKFIPHVRDARLNEIFSHNSEFKARNFFAPILLHFCAFAAFSVGVFAQEVDGRLHLLPFIVDGDNIRSRLLITNVSDASGNCSLDLIGPELDTDRFGDHHLVTAAGARATFDLEEDGSFLIWSSEGLEALTFGYATLDCAEPVAAQVLYSSDNAGEFFALTSLESARKADEFQFTLIPRVGSLVLVFANDMEPDASCAIELKSPYGSVLSEASITVPAMTSVFQTVDELFSIPEDYTTGVVRAVCGGELAATGFLLKDNVFTTLPPVILTPPPTPPVPPEPEAPVDEPSEPPPEPPPEPSEPSPEPPVQPPVNPPEPPVQPPVQPPEPPVQPPEPPRQPTIRNWRLTLSQSSGRSAIIRWTIEPEDAHLSLVGFTSLPDWSMKFGDGSLFDRIQRIQCRRGFTGDATIYASASSNGVRFETTATFRCT